MAEERKDGGLWRLTGMWEKDGRNGKFMSGVLGQDITLPAGTKVFVFENTKRERDAQPSHELKCALPEDAESPTPDAPPAGTVTQAPF